LQPKQKVLISPKEKRLTLTWNIPEKDLRR
jgi:hypothetical protein